MSSTVEDAACFKYPDRITSANLQILLATLMHVWHLHAMGQFLWRTDGNDLGRDFRVVRVLVLAAVVVNPVHCSFARAPFEGVMGHGLSAGQWLLEVPIGAGAEPAAGSGRSIKYEPCAGSFDFVESCQSVPVDRSRGLRYPLTTLYGRPTPSIR